MSNTLSSLIIDQLSENGYSPKKINAALGIDASQRSKIANGSRKLMINEFFSLLLFMNMKFMPHRVGGKSEEFIVNGDLNPEEFLKYVLQEYSENFHDHEDFWNNDPD